MARILLIRILLIRSLMIAFIVILMLAAGVRAQTAPPIKPGLWQFHSERLVNGQKVPDASERLKNLSPERRAQFEAMMKERGLGSGAGGTRQLCYTREMIEKSPWAEQQTDCKTTFVTRSAASWKWHSSCAQSNYEADGEAVFTNSENYTVQSTSVSKIGDKVRNSQTTITAKWLSSDCGDVKPLDLKP